MYKLGCAHWVVGNVKIIILNLNKLRKGPTEMLSIVLGL